MRGVGVRPYRQALFAIAILAAPSGAIAQNSQRDCNVFIYGDAHGDVFVYCYKPGEKPETGKTPAQVRTTLHQAIMEYIGSQIITRGRPEFIGKPFRTAYRTAKTPKAVAICLDWASSTPSRVNIAKGQAQFQFITGAGTCKPKSEQDAGECAVAECNQHASCSGKQSCELLDVNDENKLSPPASWTKRWQ
jgi:hypothetical protein